jgi:hypothetical protein
MNTKRLVTKRLPDGTVLIGVPDEGQPHFAESVVKGDVELREALAALRAGGCPRPVVFYLGREGPDDLAAWRMVLPTLREKGVAVWNAMATGADDDSRYVLRTDDARRLVRDIFQIPDAARMFREPRRDDSFWTAGIEAEGVMVTETRLLPRDFVLPADAN